ncbi:two-component system response regulator [Photobacterium jeanii]|uniref:Two-component system response regulator n=1 Tax=Photobacterium jeanii TaxID=858640 RepID=A0A178KN42_9GAMM|nr:sigma-54 dependent transcriptional regulator [Photobacterium jeanii]OAN18661.1 two-component system response regulator [Photobacterium jeanii]PST91659.1 sigma-54-dependent Fis family transcriptional regulator [Photobacterium jeanii]
MKITNDTQVLVIDDDQDVVEAYQDLLEIAGYSALAVTDPTKAVDMLHKDWAGVVVTDIYMPGLSGIELLDQIKQLDHELPVIMITGHGDIPMAVDAVKKGAVDFLQKPLQPEQLLELLERFLPQRQQVIAQRLTLLKGASNVLLGDSPLICKIRDQVAETAPTLKDVLIEGCPGTGRSTVARLLHDSSQIRQGPYATLRGSDVSTTPDLQRSMISARSGSLCLHNPQDMPKETQKWLCRFLLEQERQGKKEVRVLAVTDGGSEQQVETEAFLPELFYFLSQVRISLPTVQQRTCDIAPLFKHFLKQSCLTLKKPVPAVDKAYINTLNRHEWTGNVLEIKNVAELYAIGIVKLAGQERTKPLEQMSSPLDDLVDNYEKQVIEDALYLFAGRINEVSSYLQIPRKKLYLRMKKHNLDKAEYKVRPTN